MKTHLDYIDIAARLTGSNNIDIIIDAAQKIMVFAQPCAYAKPTNLTDFAATCAVMHPVLGAVPFLPYPYQRDLMKSLEGNKPLTMLTHSRQMGTSTTLGVYALWEAVSKPNQMIIVGSERLAMSLDMLARIKIMIENSKMEMPEITTYNKSGIEFINGSRILARAITETALRGVRPTHLIIDNAAYISYKTLEDFWTSLLPHRREIKIVMASTPRLAEGPFFRLWDSNIPDEKIHISWDKHPGRDNVWANQQRQVLSPTAFSQEHEALFTKVI
jgi:hypothetical protein